VTTVSAIPGRELQECLPTNCGAAVHMRQSVICLSTRAATVEFLANQLMAWVLTLPAAIMLSGFLYWVFSHIL
jgi:phosphate/sulfate permease